jgi:squalene-hopene/tetraprenyl-beta-curcumene cyclase
LSSTTQDAHLAHQILTDRLRSLQNSDGYWEGRLSNSALSTATAISALSVCLRECLGKPHVLNAKITLDTPDHWTKLVEHGATFLYESQNEDGGFGDTDRSHSNIATTFLVVAAWRLAGKENTYANSIRKAEAYIDLQGGWDGLRRRYGKDKTFVVPILSNCALAGMVSWKTVSPLPFEAAALPQSWYRFAQMPVVSYAIPALVAIGQSRFIHAPTRNPILWLLRKLALKRTRNVLRRMQPDSGGYLEATPLTSFVLMNLASIGQVDSEVAVHCRKFLIESVQADGSWPIDTNLATWVTSLAIHGVLSPSQADSIAMVQPKTIDWLMSCQHRQRHPFTGAEPGGWGWTNLSGAVPDADDTPGAMLALHAWYQQNRHTEQSQRIETAVAAGIHWLLKLQNRDGGWPTFCRGWGKLPFDRSGADLTAHAIRALSTWSYHSDFVNPDCNFAMSSCAKAIESAIRRGLQYLRKTQRSDGSWLPLWFGNQDHPEEENSIYGTARVLLALGDLTTCEQHSNSLQKRDSSNIRAGIRYLMSQQNDDGGWGGGRSIRYPSRSDQAESNASHQMIVSSIEETSVTIEGLSACRSWLIKQDTIEVDASSVSLIAFDHAVERAVAWLASKVKLGDCDTSQPIGFYFAKLWYYERLYPFVFAAAALRRYGDAMGQKAR